ncbi:MAG: CoB--CoM heterodisulfide reductase iron-sulfur subunit B family protein [Bacillota bacterium]|nr:CoB--CoM heterodisulfide reductase iron-sulfur subunit B family protein [Bacillota bacterium]
MVLGFYPGCSLKGSSREYTESVIAITRNFGIELQEIPDWNCCGATAAHNLNRELSLALPARILALAEKEGMKEILIPCAACYSRLATAQYELNKDPELKEKVIKIIGMPYSGDTVLLNVIQMLDKYITPNLEGKIIEPYLHKVACYYGCLLVRPHNILKFDREEDPQSMDILVKKLGAEPIDWAFKTECCGGGLSISRTSTVGRLSGEIIRDAQDRKAEAIVVACPMCHSNLDMRRPEINNYLGMKVSIPVLFITEVLGLALGIDSKSLGLERHFVKVFN